MQSAIPMTRTQRNLKNRPTTDARSNAKPAVIHLVNGETIHADDHDTGEGDWVLELYADRPGVAKKIPREAILFIDLDVTGEVVNRGEDSW